MVFSKVHNVEHTSLRIFNLLFLALSLPNVVLKGKKKNKKEKKKLLKGQRVLCSVETLIFVHASD